MPDRLLIVTVTPTADAALDDAEVERAVRAFSDALGKAVIRGQQVIGNVTFSWESVLPTPGSVLAALVTVLTERGHDPTVIAERIGRVDEDELWQQYLGPAVDRLEFLLELREAETPAGFEG
jgi:hypothetical protein